MKRFLIFMLTAVSAYGATEPILLDTKSHKFISPLTVDFAGVTVLNFPGGGGGGVTSFNGRTGVVVPLSPDYAAFYAPLAAALPTGGTTGQSLTKNTNADYDVSWSTVSGGGGTPGGSNTQLQYNNAGAFGGIGTATFSGGTISFRSGAGQTRFVDNSDPTKTAEFAMANVPTATSEVVVVPNSANPVIVASDAGATNNFLTGITGLGVITKAQPSFTNLSGSIATTQGGIPTGGTAGQALTKINATDYNTQWTTLGGSGTVTSFSAGDLAPIFTSTVTNATTTPAHTFTLSTAAAHNFLGNNTGSTAVPAYVRPAITDLANLSTASKLVGSNASAAPVVEISLGANLGMNGNVLNTQNVQSQATFANNAPAQAIPASTDTYVTNSGLSVPSTLRVGAKFIWHIRITKTSAGTAAAVWSMRFGTNGTTADTAQVTATSAAQAATATTDLMEVVAYVTTTGASGNIVGQFERIPGATGGGIGGLGTQVASGNFDLTVPSSIIGLSVNTGTVAAWTIDRVITEIVN